MPYLKPPGARQLTTNSDGMYIFAHPADGFADVIAIEHCGKNQNFNDKRSRYTPGGGNLHLAVPLDWLKAKASVGSTYWKASNWFSAAPVADLLLTVRHLRVVLALTPKDYKDFHDNHFPAAHEYFCKHTDLQQYTQQGMQDFIKSLAMMKHFKSRP